MTETIFDELKRYVRFDVSDETSLRAFLPVVESHLDQVVEAFYERAVEHEQASRAFASAEQVAGHKLSLRDWLRGLFKGPWDAAYYERRLRIGPVHVWINLPQRFMFGAMTVIRLALTQLAERERREPERGALLRALHKLLDIELAIMLESYREADGARPQPAERLVLSEARYEEIVEKADALITTFDRQGRVLLFNAKCEQMTGLSRASAYGSSWLELFVNQADHAVVQARHEQTLLGQATASYEGSLPVVASGLRRVRWHFTSLPNGATPALCAIGTDVSNEHELGIRTRRAERMAALGTMAAGLAHELRNPLNAAHLQLSVAERRLARGDIDAEATKAAVTTAGRELKRLGALVHDFLQFAQPQALNLRRVELREMLASSVARVASEAQKRRVTLRILPGDPIPIEADSEKVEQLLLNLVQNAIEAVGPGGCVDLSAALSGEYAELVVHDDGPGVPADSAVFAPFYTTKEYGTGLGLAIVHRIAMDHGGQVAFQSLPGDTRFTVSLPRSHAN